MTFLKGKRRLTKWLTPYTSAQMLLYSKLGEEKLRLLVATVLKHGI